MATSSQQGAASALPLSLIAQAIPKLTRHDLEALTERLIDYLDALDPNPDIEANGDELDGSNAEDEFQLYATGGKLSGPGCGIADPDCAVDDLNCDEDFDREEEMGLLRAAYGLDQTRGPVMPSDLRHRRRNH